MTSLAESVTKTQDDSMINTQDDKMTQDDRMINTHDDMMTQDDRITTLAESIRERYSETGEDEDDSSSNLSLRGNHGQLERMAAMRHQMIKYAIKHLIGLLPNLHIL